MLLCLNYSNAQNIDPATGLTLNSTGNVLNLGGGLPWSNTVTGAAGGFSGGSTAAYNPSTGNIIFGYNQSTVSQTVAINTALAIAGTGIQLSGYKYSWQINNDLSNYGGNRGTLTGNVSLTGAAGNVLESFNYNYSQSNLPSLATFSGTQLFTNRYDTLAASNITVSFTGKDQNWWAGYYGPRVHVDNLSLLYTLDPCKSNPAYSSTCAGFNNIVTSNNLFNSSIWGNSITQAFAINTALKNGGIGATVHGFNYGFDYTIGQSWSGCTATNQDGSCSWYMNIPAQVYVTAQLTNSNNQLINSKIYSLTGDGTSGTVREQYLLPTSLNQTALGNGRLAGSTSGSGSSISNFSASLIYTPDPCVSDPLYSTTCSGYAVAYAKNMLLGSTVASASGPISSGSNNSTTAPVGTVDQSSSQQPAQQQQAQQNTSPQQSPQQSAAQDPNQNSSVVQMDPSQPSTQQGPAPTSPQPAGGPQSTASSSPQQQQSGPSSGPSNLAMSVLKTSQEKDKATQQLAVQNAAKVVENSTQQSQTTATSAIASLNDMSSNSAQAAAQFASQTTQSSTQTSVQTNQYQQTTQSSVQSQQIKNIQQSQQSVYTMQQQDNTTQSFNGTGLSMYRPNSVGLNLYSSTNNATIQQSLQSAPVMQFRNESKTFEVEQPTMQVSNFNGIGKPGNPLSDLMNQRMEMLQTTIEQRNDTVKKNVQPNELAEGTDVTAMAQVPRGYEVYSLVILRDAPFYKPESIYKNQTTVDNARVFRGLSGGSDSLHKQMVDSQYKQGD